jgi:hypothetical protein
MKEAIEEKLNQEAVAPSLHRSQRFYRWSQNVAYEKNNNECG